MSAALAAECAARESYGRLLALLAARCGDVACAEDALAEAFLAALRRWPQEGTPANPEAWLFTAARHRLVDVQRHARVRAAALPALEWLQQEGPPPTPFADERLKLLYVCAHPAIAREARAPLMLQTVLGLSVERMAPAFLAAPKTLGQRLWRAKQKIAAAGIPFEVPAASALPARTADVLDAIYAAYGTGWEALPGADADSAQGLAEEALWLARTVVALLPQAAEPKALLALLLYCESRRAARRDAAGRYVPLREQNTAPWNAPLIEEAEALLRESLRQARAPGPYGLEAAIQSAHATRRVTGCTNWPAIAALYGLLVQATGSLGAAVAHAAAVAEAQGAAAALALLDALPEDATRSYQPCWALRAHLLRGHDAEASRAAFQRAAGLTQDAAVRQWLLASMPS